MKEYEKLKKLQNDYLQNIQGLTTLTPPTKQGEKVTRENLDDVERYLMDFLSKLMPMYSSLEKYTTTLEKTHPYFDKNKKSKMKN